MEKNSLIEKIGEFISSSEWWNEILEFKTTNCVIFTNDVEDPPNQKEFLCYKSYLHIVINLIDYCLCEKLGIDSDEFEKIMFESYEEGNHQAKIIIETLEKATNFENFREEMIRENEEADDEMDDMIQELAQNEEFDELNNEFLEKSIGRIVETTQNQTITAQAQKKCMEIEMKLNIAAPEKKENEQQEQVFSPHEPEEQANIIGKLGPLRPLGRTEFIKRNNTAGNHPNRMMQAHSPGIIKPVMLKNNKMNRIKTGKVVLPPLSVM